MVELFESLKENIFKGLTLAKFAGFCFNGFEECQISFQQPTSL